MFDALYYDLHWILGMFFFTVKCCASLEVWRNDGCTRSSISNCRKKHLVCVS